MPILGTDGDDLLQGIPGAHDIIFGRGETTPSRAVMATTFWKAVPAPTRSTAGRTT